MRSANALMERRADPLFLAVLAALTLGTGCTYRGLGVLDQPDIMRIRNGKVYFYPLVPPGSGSSRTVEVVPYEFKWSLTNPAGEYTVIEREEIDWNASGDEVRVSTTQGTDSVPLKETFGQDVVLDNSSTSHGKAEFSWNEDPIDSTITAEWKDESKVHTLEFILQIDEEDPVSVELEHSPLLNPKHSSESSACSIKPWHRESDSSLPITFIAHAFDESGREIHGVTFHWRYTGPFIVTTTDGQKIAKSGTTVRASRVKAKPDRSYPEWRRGSQELIMVFVSAVNTEGSHTPEKKDCAPVWSNHEDYN